MKILPFLDIPVVEIDTPPSQTRKTDLSIWSSGDMVKFSAAFVCYDNRGYKEDDYIYQIGFIREDCLVTTKKVIEEVGELSYEVERKTHLVEYLVLLPDIRLHMNLYFEKIGAVPYWGTSRFHALKEAGRTIRILEGPHKGCKLTKEERRQVILDDGKMIYGPLVKRTKL